MSHQSHNRQAFACIGAVLELGGGLCGCGNPGFLINSQAAGGSFVNQQMRANDELALQRSPKTGAAFQLNCRSHVKPANFTPSGEGTLLRNEGVPGITNSRPLEAKYSQE